MNADDLPDILTVDEVARFLRISRGLAFAGTRRGEIPSIRVGRRVLVPRAQLLAWLGVRADDTIKSTAAVAWAPCSRD